MAVKYKDIKAQIENPSLTTEEMKLIDAAEEAIDKQITEQTSGGNAEVKITFDHVKDALITIPDNKGNAVYVELKKRYKVAGWTLSPSEDKNYIWVLRGSHARKPKK